MSLGLTDIIESHISQSGQTYFFHIRSSLHVNTPVFKTLNTTYEHIFIYKSYIIKIHHIVAHI